MPYLVVAFLVLIVGLVSFLSSQSMVEKGLSVVIPLVLTVVLMGMAKARDKLRRGEALDTKYMLMPEQVRAVAQVLAVPAIESHFKGKGPWKNSWPRILETLESLGRARRAEGDRWAG